MARRKDGCEPEYIQICMLCGHQNTQTLTDIHAKTITINDSIEMYARVFMLCATD